MYIHFQFPKFVWCIRLLTRCSPSYWLKYDNVHRLIQVFTWLTRNRISWILNDFLKSEQVLGGMAHLGFVCLSKLRRGPRSNAYFCGICTSWHLVNFVRNVKNLLYWIKSGNLMLCHILAEQQILWSFNQWNSKLQLSLSHAIGPMPWQNGKWQGGYCVIIQR